MLLPSAFSCDPSHPPPLTRLQSALFVSPPASPPQLSTQHAIGNLFSTCRNLQSLLASPPMPMATVQQAEPITPPSSSHSHSNHPQPAHQLPTPPMAHAPPPLKLRLRSRRSAETPADAARKRIVKRAPPAARGPNKRRRGDDDVESDLDLSPADDAEVHHHAEAAPTPADAEAPEAPATPKRARIAPAALPLGLERGDFHALHADGVLPDGSSRAHGSDVQVEADGAAWSAEEDRMLVELVLEKLRLSKTDWAECARSLGKERGSLGRRWKSLMAAGEVGLRRGGGRGRGKIHATWRA